MGSTSKAHEVTTPQTYEEAAATAKAVHSAEFTKEVAESRRSFESLLVDYINDATDSLDKWLVTLSGIGLSASFGALASGNVEPEYLQAMQAVSLILSAALGCALVSKGIGSWGAIHILSKVRNAKKLNPGECRDFLDSIDIHKYDKIVIRLNFVCFSLMVISVAAIAIAILRAPQEASSHEQQQQRQQSAHRQDATVSR